MPDPLNRHSELHALLTQLNLTAMSEAFADVALRAAKEGLSHKDLRHHPMSQHHLLFS